MSEAIMERHLGTLHLMVMGVSVTVTDAVYYPYIPSTQIDPPENEMAEWSSVKVGDQDISVMFQEPYNARQLESELIRIAEGEM